MKYKGQLMARGTELVMLFVFLGILLGAGALALAGMQTSYGQQTNNGTVLSTLGNASSGLTQFSQQLPTVGIVGGIALLILVLIIGFGAFLMKRK